MATPVYSNDHDALIALIAKQEEVLRRLGMLDEKLDGIEQLRGEWRVWKGIFGAALGAVIAAVVYLWSTGRTP